MKLDIEELVTMDSEHIFTKLNQYWNFISEEKLELFEDGKLIRTLPWGEVSHYVPRPSRK